MKIMKVLSGKIGMLVFLSCVFLKKFHLKLHRECRFLGGTAQREYPGAVTPQNADILNGDINTLDGHITVDSKQSKVFSVDASGKLYIGNKLDRPQQKFTFNFLSPNTEGEKFLMLKNQGKCLRYMEKEHLFTIKDCNSEDYMQLFEYRDYGDISCIRKSILTEEYILKGNMPKRGVTVDIPISYVNGKVSI